MYARNTDHRLHQLGGILEIGGAAAPFAYRWRAVSATQNIFPHLEVSRNLQLPVRRELQARHKQQEVRIGAEENHFGRTGRKVSSSKGFVVALQPRSRCKEGLMLTVNPGQRVVIRGHPTFIFAQQFGNEFARRFRFRAHKRTPASLG
ncbi:MAG TPA: hypothetical protein VGJ09_01880 [Bryobacteraceae bacterium]